MAEGVKFDYEHLASLSNSLKEIIVELENAESRPTRLEGNLTDPYGKNRKTRASRPFMRTTPPSPLHRTLRQWAGVVLAVLAFTVGGPIIVALGAIVAVVALALALAIYNGARGNSSPLELGLAIVGVVPFGSVAKFAGGFRSGALGFADDMLGGFATHGSRATLKTAIREFPAGFVEFLTPGGNSWRQFGAAFSGSNTKLDLCTGCMGTATPQMELGLWTPVGALWAPYSVITAGS